MAPHPPGWRVGGITVDSAGLVITASLCMLALLFLFAGGLVGMARWSRGGLSPDGGIDANLSRRRPLPGTAADQAEALLRDVLDADEYEQLTTSAFVDVKSPADPDRIYRIPAYGGQVRVYERGAPVRNLCIQPVDPLPSADVVAIHKLMIQAAEQDYLARARRFAIP